MSETIRQKSKRTARSKASKPKSRGGELARQQAALKRSLEQFQKCTACGWRHDEFYVGCIEPLNPTINVDDVLATAEI
ncbi:MAG TPA: hypothetical protein VK137_08640 [Planctomycetaceae bacterium]|nr:hypothetical protein [Planctomycetaceae bacterium]